MMLRFFPNKFPAKSFFSPKSGYTNWDFLNNEYQIQVSLKVKFHLNYLWSMPKLAFIYFLNHLNIASSEI